jgi:hypothetical protein
VHASFSGVGVGFGLIELCAPAADDSCALARDVKRAGILWITANTLYFSSESCKLLLPVHEILSITRHACAAVIHSPPSTLDESIELCTDNGTVRPPSTTHGRTLLAD